MEKGKIIVIAAPSGCGKSTIINALMEHKDLNLGFAVSAATREPRPGEKDGVNYYFMTEQEFRHRIEADEFVEYEEVYAGRLYGTLRSEIVRITGQGQNIILDLDVNGALRVKDYYKQQAITLFIQPPSIAVLRNRLECRGTETQQSLVQRIERAEYELTKVPHFDYSIVNDDLVTAVEQTYTIICNFLGAN